MNTATLARRIAHWTRTYPFPVKVISEKTEKGFTVYFEYRTTKTRASSMVTRVQLIANEVLMGIEFSVEKQLVSEPPPTRESLATWKIEVSIPFLKEARRAA